MNTLHHPDLDRCRKLTEIGFPETEKCFCIETKIGGEEVGEPYMRTRSPIGYYAHEKELCFCPSVMELLDVIKNKDEYIEVDITKYPGGTCKTRVQGDLCESFEGTLPNALADLVIWLHENKHISFTQ